MPAAGSGPVSACRRPKLKLVEDLWQPPVRNAVEQLPRQVLWKGLKSGSLDKAEIVCPQCRQVLRITPKSLLTILALAILPTVPITLWFIFYLAPRPHEIVILVLLVLIPMNIALLIVFYLKLARFREKPRPFSIRG